MSPDASCSGEGVCNRDEDENDDHRRRPLSEEPSHVASVTGPKRCWRSRHSRRVEDVGDTDESPSVFGEVDDSVRAVKLHVPGEVGARKQDQMAERIDEEAQKHTCHSEARWNPRTVQDDDHVSFIGNRARVPSLRDSAPGHSDLPWANVLSFGGFGEPSETHSTRAKCEALRAELRAECCRASCAAAARPS